jgi:rubrerythrin
MPPLESSAAKGWVCPVDGTTAPHLGDEHALACPKCGRKMVRRVCPSTCFR